MTAAKKVATNEVYLETGVVVRALVGAIEVRHDSGVCQAKRAKSCLVAPDVGDTVLCSFGSSGTFVLAVLDGGEREPTRLAVEGDLHIHSQIGRVAVSARQGVDLVSADAVTVTSAEVHVRASRGSVAVDDLGFFGNVFRAQLAKVTLAADEVETVVTRLTQRARRVFRFVEELDQTRAGTVDLRAQNLVGIRGENAIISARVLAKIDGEQIHLG